MPPKKGLATAKKVEKYMYVDADDEISPPALSVKAGRPVKRSSPLRNKTTPAKQPRQSWSLADLDENVDPVHPRGIPKLSNLDQPCQASESFHSDQLQQGILANSLFPRHEEERAQPRVEAVDSNITTKPPTPVNRTDSPLNDTPRKPSPLHDRNAQTERHSAKPSQPTELPTRVKRLSFDFPTSPHQTHLPSDPPIYESTTKMANMIPGGAFVPPNQQRNLRACMVCSIVRTYTQFMNGGCPNCEEILELTGNSENVNDCTSQVFEGLITVADTSKSWVARYQRLEGYVPGVYATQVEGILPEEIVSAIEAAGINYVPRDGSEDQMIPKD